MELLSLRRLIKHVEDTGLFYDYQFVFFVSQLIIYLSLFKKLGILSLEHFCKSTSEEGSTFCKSTSEEGTTFVTFLLLGYM